MLKQSQESISQFAEFSPVLYAFGRISYKLIVYYGDVGAAVFLPAQYGQPPFFR